MMPLSRKTNQVWKADSPATFITRNAISYKISETSFKDALIDKVAFDFMVKDLNGVEQFWKHRSEYIAAKLLSLTELTI